MMQLLKNWRAQKNAEDDLVNEIIRSMKEESMNWQIGAYTADYGRLSIWIANSPYADMRINNRRLPRRGELRKALAMCLMTQARNILTKKL